jgi:serine/threonine protein kinase
MTIPAGTHLGSYEILAPIGAGGMGEVYEAHDTRLGRDVAIKVLSEAVAHDPERLSRFQREDEDAGFTQPSQHRGNLRAGRGRRQEQSRDGTGPRRDAAEAPLPVEEALGVCRQIAEALEAAHEKGIVNRDLKPAYHIYKYMST